MLIVYLRYVCTQEELHLEKEYQTRYISDVSDVVIDIVVVQLPTYLTYHKGEVRFRLLRGIISYRLRRQVGIVEGTYIVTQEFFSIGLATQCQVLAQGLGWHAFFFRIACIRSKVRRNVISYRALRGYMYLSNTGFGTCQVCSQVGISFYFAAQKHQQGRDIGKLDGSEILTLGYISWN